MPGESQPSSEIFQGHTVLIAEDDVLLSEQLSALLKEDMGLNPIVVHDMQSADERITAKRPDLAIMDVMLPSTPKNFYDIQKYAKKLDDLRKVILENIALEDMVAEAIVENARDNRAQILEIISELIDRTGGTDLVNKWKKENKLSFPVLFLTAVGNAAQEQVGLSGDSIGWIVKPASGQAICNKCKVLLVQQTPKD